MQSLAGELAELQGRTFGDYTVTLADEFSYQDPIDGSLATNQGMRIVFGDAARIIVRLSGTGTKGATLRLYLERYENHETTLGWKTSEALAPLVNIAEKIVRVAEITGRRAPSVVT
jgi:phosphoglucomutase